MTSIIILDRDGVINEDSPDYIRSPEEWIPIPGSLEAIAKLNQAGFKVVVATNQSGLARGYYDEACLAQIHDKMMAAVEAQGGKIEGIYYCPHGPQAGCDCRKPLPGLLHKIQIKYQLSSLTEVPFVGDSLRDLQAAKAAGARGVLVKTGKGEKTFQQHQQDLISVPVFENLLAFMQDFLKTGG